MSIIDYEGAVVYFVQSATAEVDGCIGHRSMTVIMEFASGNAALARPGTPG